LAAESLIVAITSPGCVDEEGGEPPLLYSGAPGKYGVIKLLLEEAGDGVTTIE